jgi:hypothetical protein
MKNKSKNFLAIVFTIFLLNISVFACTCVRNNLKLKGFRGQVFAVNEAQPDYKEPFPKATVRLLERNDDEEKIIAEVLTDENGKFEIEKFKSGKYILEIFAPNFQKVVTRIKITKSSSRKLDNLVIGLEPSLDCCVGFAKVEKS